MKILAKTSILILTISFLFSCAGGNKTIHAPTADTTLVRDIRPIIGKEALTNTINTILQDSVLSATTAGIKVVRISDGEVLYQQNSNKLFHPASNMKLFTSAMALLHLGPEYRFTTSVVIDSAISISDTLRGDIFLIGTGDPSFQTGDLAEIVEELHSRGIRYISGNVVCDDSWLDDLRYGQGWTFDDQPWTYAAPIGALTINGNSLEIFTAPGPDSGASVLSRLAPQTKYVQIINESTTLDSATYQQILGDTSISVEPLSVLRRWREQNNIIDIKGKTVINSGERHWRLNVVDPTAYFGALFMEYCERNGIRISGGITRGSAPEEALVVAKHNSDPVVTLAAKMNKPSNNLYAELFLKAVGAHVKGKPGTAQKGIEVIDATLAEWGIDVSKIRFSDGSGLSRYGLLSPDVIVALLAKMYKNFSVRNEFIASLPIAGVDGTLRNRMKGMAAERIVHAKTGTLSGVCTLSGYTTSQDGEVLAFSIMMSHYVGGARPFRDVQDLICDALTRYRDTAK